VSADAGRYGEFLLPEADQAKAHADTVVTEMMAALRDDLADGHDLTYLWWTLSNSFAVSPQPDQVAVGFATALLRLANQPTRKAWIRMHRCDRPQCAAGSCPCCGMQFDGPHETVVNHMDKHIRTGWRP